MTPDLSIKSTQTVGKRIAANTGLMVGSKALGVLFGVGTLLVVTRALDPVDFGTVIFLHAYMLFFAEVATFTTWQSIIRFGTDDVKNGNSSQLASLIKFSAILDIISVIFAYLASLALFGFVVWITQVFPALASKEGLDTSTLRNYAAIYCLVVFARQIGTSIGIFRLFDRFKILAVEALIMPILRLVGSIYAAFSGWGLEGFLVVWFGASLLSYMFMMSMGLLELRKRGLLNLVFRAPIKFMRPREGLWPFVIKSNIDSTLATGNMHLPLLLVMAVFGATWAGVYKIAEEVAKLLSEGFKLLDQVIYPELAKLVVNGDAAKIWRLVMRFAFILLSFGLVCSILVFVFGPTALTKVFGADYTKAAPLASLLVPAAALLGTIAPLYPIFYAADKPERAIYARGAGLLVYISSFLIFSFTIGKMAPGWAALAGNGFAVLAVLLLAKVTLNSRIADDARPEPVFSDHSPGLSLTGYSEAKIWGLPIKKWQTRAYKKAGCCVEDIDGVYADVNWVLSANLGKAFVAAPGTALLVDNTVIAVNGGAPGLIGLQADETDLKAHDLIGKSPAQIAGTYDKALRKTEHPYALDVRVTPVVEIMKRQFDSSYKGITDFVTKFFWPVPAFYVTRLCAALRLTPNMVTTLSLIMMFVAMYYFWQGQWALGFLSGWFMTFLDTVDGKLARTTMTYSAWGNAYDHGIDLIHPPFWYLAWFIGLGSVFAWGEPMTFALLAIFAGYVVDRLIEGIFILLHGFHIHVWRPINSGMRFITARRNPNMFIFMIGIILMVFKPEAGVWGFYAVAVWTWVCILFNVGVVFVSLFARRPLVSWMDQ